MDSSRRATAWIDGIRGLAALGVLSAHLSSSLSTHSSVACCAPGSSSPSALQLPPLRLLAAAQTWLAVFFVVSGMVLGLRVLSPRQEDKYAYIALQTLKRPMRIFLPAALATVLSWALAQAGLFVPARRSGSLMLAMASPEPEPSWKESFIALWDAISRTQVWLGPENRFEIMQWALVYIVQGGFITQMALLATLSCRTWARLGIWAVLWWRGWDWSYRLVDPLITPAFMTGLILAQLHVLLLRRPFLMEKMGMLCTVALPAAVLFLSFAKDSPELNLTMRPLIPFFEKLPEHRDRERAAGVFGSGLLIAGIMTSSLLQRVFGSAIMRRLGRDGEAIVLLHMTIVRLLIPYLVYFRHPVSDFRRIVLEGDISHKDLDYPLREWRVILGAAVITAVSIAAADLWASHVEPVCDKIIRWVLASISLDEVSKEKKQN